MVQTPRPRTTSPEGRGTVLKKREILEAASRVFREKGLHAAGMREIAAEAGMHVGNLYYYFANKEALLAFCQLDTLAGLRRMAVRVEELELEADAKLYLLVLGHVLQLNQETPGSLAHLEIEALGPDWRPQILEERDAYESVYRRVIHTGIGAEIFRETEVKVAALAILGAVNWTVKWFRPGGSKSASEIGELFAQHLVRGLLAPERAFTAPDIHLLDEGISENKHVE